MQYQMMYRSRLGPEDLAGVPVKFDILISAYNESRRVLNVFDRVPASERIWAVHPEYSYSPSELPTDERIVTPTSEREATFVRELLDDIGLSAGRRMCIDITGFMGHTLLVLLRTLVLELQDRFWLIYSDPIHYSEDENTTFSTAIREVRQVDGYQGSHDPSHTVDDHMILGTGYDSSAMRAVAEHKRHAWRTDMLGLPSLQPSMYQENVLSVAELASRPGQTRRVDPIFAAANDPFGTAQALHNEVEARGSLGNRNLYLAPTGTKAQIAGFGLYFLAECTDQPVSIVMPFPSRYERETSQGHARSWLYEIDTRFFLGLREGAMM